jgi:hypothetical protein
MLKIRTYIASLSLVFATVVVTATAAHAAPITLPTGLNPGDQYRLVFVTSSTRNATSFDIADYNSFVSGVANGVTELAALGTNWTAIASTPRTDARDNTDTSFGISPDLPIYLLDGTKVAHGISDFWNSSRDVPINITETGSFVSGLEFVWTGTNTLGAGELGEWLGAFSPFVGNILANHGGWINDGGSLPSSVNLSFYGMSGVLTVTAVQEPAPVAILAMSLVVLTAGRRLRWRR